MSRCFERTDVGVPGSRNSGQRDDARSLTSSPVRMSPESDADRRRTDLPTDRSAGYRVEAVRRGRTTTGCRPGARRAAAGGARPRTRRRSRNRVRRFRGGCRWRAGGRARAGAELRIRARASRVTFTFTPAPDRSPCRSSLIVPRSSTATSTTSARASTAPRALRLFFTPREAPRTARAGSAAGARPCPRTRAGPPRAIPIAARSASRRLDPDLGMIDEAAATRHRPRALPRRGELAERELACIPRSGAGFSTIAAPSVPACAATSAPKGGPTTTITRSVPAARAVVHDRIPRNGTPRRVRSSAFATPPRTACPHLQPGGSPAALDMRYIWIAPVADRRGPAPADRDELRGDRESRSHRASRRRCRDRSARATAPTAPRPGRPRADPSRRAACGTGLPCRGCRSSRECAGSSSPPRSAPRGASDRSRGRA